MSSERMTKKVILTTLLGLTVLAIVFFLTRRTTARDTFEFFYELRVPKTAKFEPDTSFDLVTDSGASGTRLHLTTRREEGDSVIFADSSLVFAGDKRRAMVMRTDGQPSQVFQLALPGSPKPADWTKWQRPDYTEKTEAWWTFMHDSKKHDRSTNVPPDSFELRFKITEWKSP
jgi:hypothetical protein